MFAPHPQRAGLKPRFALHSSIPRLLMAAIVVGGSGSILFAGSARAAATLITPPGGTICNFGGSSAGTLPSPPALPGTVAPVCSTAISSPPSQPYLLNDKILTLLTPPSGRGYLDFIATAYPPIGPDEDTWNVKYNFSTPFGPSATPGVLTYRLQVDQVLEPFAYFKRVSLDSQHDGRGTVVTKLVYSNLADMIAGSGEIVKLTSTNGSASSFDFPVNTFKDLFVKDVYAPGLNGSLTTLNNSFTQGDTSHDTVPGPLPLLGAGAAFGFSRKLRSRIKGSAKA
jgi:hypothetical protein